MRRLALLLLCGSCRHAAAQTPARESRPAATALERWFRGTMGGTPVGYERDRATLGADGSAQTFTDLLIVLTRLGNRVEISAFAETREDPNGNLRTVTSRLVASRDTTLLEATVGAGEVTVVRRVGGRSFPTALPVSGPLLGPEGVRHRIQTELVAPGDSIVYRTFLADAGTVARIVVRMLASERVECEGRWVEARKLEQHSEQSSMVTTQWVDGNGRPVQTDIPGPFGLSRFTWDDEGAARAAAGGGAELPAERYLATLARTQLRLPRAREISSLTLELHHREPALGWPAFGSVTQRVISSSPDRLTLSVKRPPVPRGVRRPVASSDAAAPYLAPNAYVQSTDSNVVALARRIVGSETDLYRAALRLRRWVADSMRFDAGIVLAPSTELLRDRHGTCVGYATLLATLTRAAGIPSRIAMGYVYLNGIFGGHAWTEILAGHDWIPIDAALTSEGVADAARFAFTWTSLENGVGSLASGGGQQLYGKLDVRVTAYAVAEGAEVSVPASRAPYRVTGNHYVNPGLGLSLTKPDRFAFEGLDAVWPSDTLLAMSGPSEARLLIVERPRPAWEPADSLAAAITDSLVPGGTRASWHAAGRDVRAAETPQRAALVLPVGQELFVWSATGPGAGRLLRRVVGTLAVRQ